MSEAIQRNAAAANRERERRLAATFRGEMPIGSLAVTGDQGWDAFWGSLADKREAANAAGMGFRGDLSGIGRWAGGDEPAQPSANQINYGLGRLADENAARQLALKDYADRKRDAAIDDMRQSYDQHVLASVGQPRMSTAKPVQTTDANGRPVYTLRADEREAAQTPRERLIAGVPGSMRPQVDAALSPLDRADRAQTETQRHNEALEDIAAKNAGTRKPLTQTSEANLITRLQNDWTKANATGKEMDRQFQIMQAGLDRFDADPNGASQAVLITFQKMLDPESVVRESEYDRSAQGLSLKARMQGYVERLARGGAGVPKAELEQMVKTAEQFRQNTKDAPEKIRRRIESTADRYELPHEVIFGEAPTAPPANAGGNSGKKQIRYDANGDPIK